MFDLSQNKIYILFRIKGTWPCDLDDLRFEDLYNQRITSSNTFLKLDSILWLKRTIWNVIFCWIWIGNVRMTRGRCGGGEGGDAMQDKHFLLLILQLLVNMYVLPIKQLIVLLSGWFLGRQFMQRSYYLFLKVIILSILIHFEIKLPIMDVCCFNSYVSPCRGRARERKGASVYCKK